jgi:hypothetical protein
VSDTCAAEVLYLPPSQTLQAADDIAVVLYMPAAQAATELPDPVSPAAPTQSSKASDASGLPVLAGQVSHVSDTCAAEVLYLPPSQALHVADPVDALNVPATQAATVPPSGPVYPTFAVQSTKASDASGLPVLAGQESHVSDTCAAEVLYLPPSQTLQAADDIAVVLYVPATHATTESPDPV